MLSVAVWLVLVTVLLVLLLLLDVAWLVLVAAVARFPRFLVLCLTALVMLDAAWCVLETVVALCLAEGGGGTQEEVVPVHLQGAARLPWSPGGGENDVSPVGGLGPTWQWRWGSIWPRRPPPGVAPLARCRSRICDCLHSPACRRRIPSSSARLRVPEHRLGP